MNSEHRILEKELAGCIDHTLLSATATSEQVKQVCREAKSYGFHPAGGATPEDIKLIEEIAPKCKIKAAGGIRTTEQALGMLVAGAHRIGTSSGVQIMEEFKAGRRANE